MLPESPEPPPEAPLSDAPVSRIAPPLDRPPVALPSLAAVHPARATPVISNSSQVFHPRGIVSIFGSGKRRSKSHCNGFHKPVAKFSSLAGATNRIELLSSLTKLALHCIM